MAIVLKVIKPKKLNDTAMRAVLLRGVFDTRDEMVKEFNKTTKTWKHKPKFESIIDTAKSPVAILVATDDEIYGYVNNGTRPHRIYPKRAGGRLAFKSGYRAKTTPGVIGSRSGGSFGDTVFSRGVKHPGTKARGFDEIIQKIMQKRFKSNMEKKMKEAARVSGHGVSK